MPKGALVSLKVSLVINAVSNALRPIRETQNKLKALQEQTGKIENYRKAQTALLQKTRALRTAKGGLQALLDEQAKTGNQSKTFQNSLNKARQAVSQAHDNVDRYKSSLGVLRTELQRSGIDTSKLSAEQARLASQTARTQASLGSQKAALGMLGTAYGKVKTVAGGFWSGLKKGLVYGGLVANTLGIVKNAVVSVVSPFVDFASKMEQSQFQLSAMLGSAEKGKDAMSWIKDFAQENPAAPLDTMVDAFTKLTAFGMPAKEMMKSLIDYNSAYGGSVENLNAMVLQLGQGWSAGTLQKEDAKVLLERGISVAKLLSNFTKRTQPKDKWLDESQVNKLMSQGRIGRDAIRAIVEQMGYEQKGKAQEVGTTWAGLMSQLTLSWQDFQDKLMSAGVFDVLKDQLRQLSDWLREQSANGNLKKWAQAISESIVPAIRDFASALKNLNDNLNIIKSTWGFVDKVSSYLPSRMVASAIGGAITSRPEDNAPSPYAKPMTTVASHREERGASLFTPTAKVQIAFDATGMPRMKAASPNQSLELETMTGRNLVGAGL